MTELVLDKKESTLLGHYLAEKVDELKGLIKGTACPIDAAELSKELVTVNSIKSKLEDK